MYLCRLLETAYITFARLIYKLCAKRRVQRASTTRMLIHEKQQQTYTAGTQPAYTFYCDHSITPSTLTLWSTIIAFLSDCVLDPVTAAEGLEISCTKPEAVLRMDSQLIYQRLCHPRQQ